MFYQTSRTSLDDKICPNGMFNVFYSTLNLSDKPKGTTFRTDASANTVSAGSSVNFMCKARGYPKPEYRFYIRTGSKPERRLDYRDAERSGKISNLGILDSTWHGTYICVPHNRLGDGPREEVILYVRCK